MKDLNLQNLQSGELNDSQSNDDNISDQSGTSSNNVNANGVHNKKISKNEKRLVQNRVSAQRFRQKRKNEFESLKDNLNVILHENELLRNQVNELNAVLKHQQEVHHQQEVQMSAIQSSLMEIFCKQILTQQGVGGMGQQNGQVNIQALASQFLSGLPSQQTNNTQLNNENVSGKDFMKNFSKLMEFQNSSTTLQGVPAQTQAKPQFNNTNDASNTLNMLQTLMQQPQQQSVNSNGAANLNQSVLQAFLQNSNTTSMLKDKDVPMSQDINQNQQIIQQLTQSLRQQDQQINRSNTPLMLGQSGIKSSPLMKPDCSHSIQLQKQTSMNLPQGVITPKCSQTYKAKMAQPIVLVNNGQGQSPVSKNITPKSGTVNMLENLIHQVRSNVTNNEQQSQINYRDRIQSYSNNISGNITPASQLLGQRENSNNINMSQITQLLKNAQNQSQTNTADLSSAETRDNSSLMKKYDEKRFGNLLNNNFSFNRLLSNNGNAVSPIQGFQQSFNQKQAEVSNNGNGETHQSKNSS